ncbi:Coiled-coil domain-containing protein 146 [Chaetura pelagica]|nr:Coiled-coil domain-containing protein 146 [Chaetura pelagica]
MSQAGEESSSSSSTELEIEKEEEPVCDLAPSICSGDEGSTDVTASPAFQCLDELCSVGKITEARVAELKGKYTLLHNTVTSLQESVTQLLQEAKRLSVELEQQQHKLEKAEQFPEECSREISQLRQQLLSCQNEYDAIKDRKHELQFKMECLQEEKRLLENECRRIPKQGELVQNSKQLKENYDELCKEVIQRKAEINAIKEDVSSKEKLILIDKEETEKLLEKQANLKDELVKILPVPVHLGRQNEKITKEKNDAEKKKEALNKKIEELTGTLKAIEERKKEILQEREDVTKELHGKQILLESKKEECIHLTKLLEISRGKELAVLSDRADLEDDLKKCALEKKNQLDILIHMQTQKDREARSLKKIEFQLNTMSDFIKQDKSQHERLTLEVETMAKKNRELLERRRELQKEIEITKRKLVAQERVSEKDAHMLEDCIAEERQLFKELEQCRAELTRLSHLNLLRIEEREQKLRDVQKAQIQLQNAISEIKRKDLQIKDYTKRKRKIKNELQRLAKTADVILEERNTCLNLVHAAQQKASEIKDHVKLLGNEIGNLRNIVTTKERELQKQHLKNTNNAAITESLRSDYLRIVKIMQEMEEKKNQHFMALERLSCRATQIEEGTAQLCEKYERAIQQKNESGLQLREREEELCILYEKMNIHEVLCRDGGVKMQVLDEKIKFLKLQVAEEERQIKLWSKALPVKNALDSLLVVLQIQYSQCKDRIKHMEGISDDPTKESRIQELGGKDTPPPELLKKAEQLEVELLQKEEKLIETDLLYKHVSQLTETLQATAETGRQDTLLSAKRINEVQKKIKEINQKITALVAELSMKKALAIQLQQEIRDKEQFLMTVSSRVDQGLPPPKEIENEWLKILRNEKMRKEAAKARAKHIAEERQAAHLGCVRTTAEQRPTAYIPEDGSSLPLPQPYGALAPFKPSERSSNLRHFRKPIVKPIKI